ncbi:UNVERIFIED_CONTAM: hypothetical protein K2H54_035938 [Gekko kuhli]
MVSFSFYKAEVRLGDVAPYPLLLLLEQRGLGGGGVPGAQGKTILAESSCQRDIRPAVPSNIKAFGATAAGSLVTWLCVPLYVGSYSDDNPRDKPCDKKNGNSCVWLSLRCCSAFCFLLAQQKYPIFLQPDS